MYYIHYTYNNHTKYSDLLHFKPTKQLLDSLIDPKNELFSITIIKLI